MKKKFTVTNQDYFDYQWHLFKRNPTARRTARIQMFLPIAVFIIICIFYFATKKPLKGLLPLGVALVLWPFIYQFFFNRSMKKKLAKLIDEMSDDLPLGDHRVTFDDEGLSDGDVQFNYGEIRYVMDPESDFYYIFYKDVPTAYLLPKEYAGEKIKAKIRK
ncbi:MAG: hypothetical protein SPI65_06140 [Peptoniphilus sp.]|nr:hypothetical protein [Peptoniphilus sp.]MDY6045135.1 hypothetical protein [Peptoniphilus sp.]